MTDTTVARFSHLDHFRPVFDMYTFLGGFYGNLFLGRFIYKANPVAGRIGGWVRGFHFFFEADAATDF